MLRFNYLRHPGVSGYEVSTPAQLSGLEPMALGSEVWIADYGLPDGQYGKLAAVVSIVAGELPTGGAPGQQPPVVRIVDSPRSPLKVRMFDPEIGRNRILHANVFALAYGTEGDTRPVPQLLPLLPGAFYPIRVGTTVAEYGVDKDHKLVIRRSNDDGTKGVAVRVIGMKDEGYVKRMPTELVRRHELAYTAARLENMKSLSASSRVGDGNFSLYAPQEVEAVVNFPGTTSEWYRFLATVRVPHTWSSCTDLVQILEGRKFRRELMQGHPELAELASPDKKRWGIGRALAALFARSRRQN